MKYLLLLYGDESAERNLSPEERRSIVDEHMRFHAGLSERGALVQGEPLDGRAGAFTVRLDKAGKRQELTEEECAKLAGQDEVEEIEAALEEAFEAGVAVVLGDEDAEDYDDEERAFRQLLIGGFLERHPLRHRLLHQLLLRRLLLRRFLKRALRQ